MLALLLLPLFLNLVTSTIFPETTCPTSIKEKIWNGGDDNGELRQIYQTLTTCAKAENSSIRTLDLDIQQAGCVVGNTDWNFHFRNRDRFPALHKLHLIGYSFTDYPKVNYGPSRAFWSRLRNDIQWWLADLTGMKLFEPTPRISAGPSIIHGSNLEKWKAAMDWTELRDLYLDDVDGIYLQSLQGQLPALKSLRLGSLYSEPCSSKNVSKFVTALNPLSRLSLRGHTERLNFSEILDRHGASLEMLKIHEWEGDHFLRPTLSRPEIEQISQKCPSLTKLSLDINRNGTWPYDLLDPLAANKNLTSLEISFELGMNMHKEHEYLSEFDDMEEANRYRNRYREPLLNLSSSLNLFRHLRSLKQGVELQELRVVVGDAYRDYGSMLRFPDWGEGLTEAYECKVSDGKGNRKAEGEAWCAYGDTYFHRTEWNDTVLGDPFENAGQDAAQDEVRKMQAEL